LALVRVPVQVLAWVTASVRASVQEPASVTVSAKARKSVRNCSARLEPTKTGEGCTETAR
jgi:hypothetical protein